jgi:hypothetical protein
MHPITKLGLALVVLTAASAASAQEAPPSTAAKAPAVAPAAVAVPESPTPAALELPLPSTDAIPPGYRMHKAANTPAIVGGAVLFTVSYGLSVFGGIIGTAANCGGDGTCEGGEVRVNYAPMYVPGVGPLIQLGQPGSRPTGVGVALAITDSAAQLGGLALLTYGLATTRTVIDRDEARATTEKPRVAVTPLVSPTQAGMGVVGTF